MQQITLDLIPNGSMPVVNASQYDDGRVFRVNITENGTPYVLTDEVIEIHVRKGDGCAVTALVAYTASKSYVDIATTEQMTAVAGNNVAEINVKKNGADIGSLNFILLVERDPLDAGVESESEIHDLQAQVNSCVQNAFDTLGAAGLPYDNTESGLEAENVQDAIDEVNAKIAEGPSDVYTKEETDALLENKADKTSVYTKTEADALLADKVSTSTLESDYYTKTETDTKLDGKANKSSVYTKTQTDALLDDKVDNSTLEDYYSSSEVDALLYQKANKNSVYTKAEINTQMAGKANVSDLANYYTKSETYSKSETDDALALKADSADVYDKTYMDGIFEEIDNAFTGVNTALGTKADKSTTYTKTETDNALSLKADKSDTYTKAQVDSALAGKVDNATLANYYTKAEVDEKVADVYPSIDVSPAPIASFETDIVLPLKSCVASIVAYQPSGTPTPASPLAISGYTGVNLTRCGVNLWDEEWESGAFNHTTGEKIINSSTIRSKNNIQIIGGTTYCMRTSLVPFNMWIQWYDINGDFISSSELYDVNTNYKTATAPINAAYLTFNLTSAYGTTYNNDVSVNYPSTDTDYHAYNGTTYAVTWQDEAGTVYGGNLDLTSGVLTVTWSKTDIGLLDYTSYVYGGVQGFYAGLFDLVEACKPEANCKCEIYSKASGDSAFNSDGINYEMYINSNRTLKIKNSDYSDAAAFKTAMNGIYLYYELATPVTYQLTPTQVDALLGVNNIYNDVNGDTEVTFRETVQKYVDDKISEL